VTTALIEHTRSSIMYERQLLRELEALNPDVANAASKVVAASNGVPKPTVVPPLEDYSQPPPVTRAESVPPILPPATTRPPPMYPTFPTAISSPARKEPLSASSVLPPSRQGVHSPSSSQSFAKPGPLSASSSHTFGQQDPLSASSSQFPRQIQSPPSTPPVSQVKFVPPPLDEPPLGGRYVDGTKSMFVKPTSSPLTPSFPSSATFGADPLQRAQMAHSSHTNSLGRAATSPLISSTAQSPNGHFTQNDSFDPLGQVKPTLMSSSVRVQPSRPRLDAREAASKLASMF